MCVCCRKGFYSINCQAMCDANKRFLWMSMNTAGATHDQLAWMSSYMAEGIALGQLPDPFCITPDAA